MLMPYSNQGEAGTPGVEKVIPKQLSLNSGSDAEREVITTATGIIADHDNPDNWLSIQIHEYEATTYTAAHLW